MGATNMMQEKAMVSDALNSINSDLKALADMISQTENPELRSTLQQMRNEAEKSQFELYNIAKNLNYYVPSQKASPQAINQVKSAFSQSTGMSGGSSGMGMSGGSTGMGMGAGSSGMGMSGGSSGMSMSGGNSGMSSSGSSGMSSGSSGMNSTSTGMSSGSSGMSSGSSGMNSANTGMSSGSSGMNSGSLGMSGNSGKNNTSGYGANI